MANFCLMPAAVNNFRQALIDGTINPAKLTEMTSTERHALFAGIVGKDAAKDVNSLFESKLLLKNQEYGMVTWAKKVTGITPEVRRDLISRIQKMDNRILDPQAQEQFLHDLAATKLGVDVTQIEAKTIADMSKQIETARINKAQGGDRLAYGRAKVALANYVNDLKNKAEKPGLKDYAMHPAQVATKTAGLAKSLKASMDNSAIFRQGWKTMFSNPVIWQKNARQSFVDLVKQVGGKEVLDGVHADIISRGNYDRMVKARLAVSNIEESFPSQLPEKVPVLGRLYKGSEAAYTGFVYRQRADIFDKYLEIAKKQGVNIDDAKQLQSIGKLVNSLTGRGNLGKLEPASSTVNSIFFSPKALKANIDTLTAHQFQKGVTPFVRKQAAISTLKVVTGTAAVLAIANAVKPGSVEFDPRSSDFGKIKVGNTRFDASGGMSSILTLAARLASQSSKSSSTGIVKKLNTGFGSQNGMDVLTAFLENKASPAASVVMDLIKQKDRNGNKPSIGAEAANLFEPLPITNVRELMADPNSANKLVGSLADALGIATNTYGKTTNDWTQNPGKQLQQFQSKVSPDEFKAANREYNQKMDAWNKANMASLKDQPDATKQQMIADQKAKAQAEVFKAHGFSYTLSPEEKAARSQKAKATHLKKLQSSALYQ